MSDIDSADPDVIRRLKVKRVGGCISFMFLTHAWNVSGGKETCFLSATLKNAELRAGLVMPPNSVPWTGTLILPKVAITLPVAESAK